MIDVFKRLNDQIQNIICYDLKAKIGIEVKRLDAANYVLISNNCLSGNLYEIAGLQKKSPTAGLFFHGASFERFVHDFLQQRGTLLSIAAQEINTDPRSGRLIYSQQGLMIVFLHYSNAANAAAKWNKRLLRALDRRPITLISIRDAITEESAARIQKMTSSALMLGSNASPAPPADKLLLNRRYLKILLKFIKGVGVEDLS